MKYLMITKPIIAMLSGLCIMASSQAQTNESQNPAAAVSAAPALALPTYNFDFPGGTPRELIDYLAKVSGTTPNVILPANVADIRIPKFKIQNVNIGEVFEALNLVADEKGNFGARWIGAGAKGAPNRVWTLAKAHAQSKTQTCQVVFIGNLLDSFQLDDINAAIQASWEMLGKSSTPSLKFHKQTNLLIVKGDDEELKLAFDVLKSLQQAAAAKKQAEVKK